MPTQNANDIVGDYYVVNTDGKTNMVNNAAETRHFHAKIVWTGKKMMELLNRPNIEKQEPNTLVLNVLWSVLPLVVIGVFIWFFFIRQIKMAGKGALSFGKSKARMLAKEKNKTTFKDVAGVEEARRKRFPNLSSSSRTRRNFKNSAGAFPRAC